MNAIAQLLEIIPVILFIITFYIKGMHYATIVIVISSVAVSFLALVFRIKVPKLFWVINSIVLLFGTMSIIFNDPTYIKLKPTIVYMISATTIFVSAVIGKPILRKGLSPVMEISSMKIWRRNSYFVSFFFIMCAILNEYVRTNYTDAVWIKFKLFGFTGITFTFFAFFIFLNKKYLKSLK